MKKIILGFVLCSFISGCTPVYNKYGNLEMHCLKRVADLKHGKMDYYGCY